MYHSSPVPLGVGSIIEPGNWGRIVRTYSGASGNVPINGLNEIALELARLAYNPGAPSRLACVFAVETVEGAASYRDMHHRAGIIYKVEPIEPEASMHVGNYQIPIATHGDAFVGQALERFRSYWVDMHTAQREVLLSCPIRILERLD